MTGVVNESLRSMSWKSPEVAATYAAAAHSPARNLGYPAVFESLSPNGADPARLLDYGCGPGDMARAAADVFGVRVSAVDTSPAMLGLARSQPHPHVDYALSPDGSLPFLSDASVDACMCCFVFVCVSTRHALRSVTTEIHRVLRPGGRFAVLGSDPASIGTAGYDDWQTEPGPYRDGSPVHSRLLSPDGTWQEIIDTFWSADTYREALTEAGFEQIHSRVLSTDGPAAGGLLLVTGTRGAPLPVSGTPR